MNFKHKLTTSFFLAVSVFASLATPVFAQNSGGVAPDAAARQGAEFSPGISVGQKVPAIKLKDQAGSELALSAVLEKSPVALVLFRSASW